MRILAAGVIALALVAGCASRPDTNVLLPVSGPDRAGTRTVAVYAITNRARIKGEPWAYDANRGAAAQDTAFEVSIPPGHVQGAIEWPDDVPDPATDFVTRSQHGISRDELLHRIGRGRAGVYVHGYNTSYQEALFRVAQLSADAHLEGTPIVFSWPSQARVSAYLEDRDSSDYSRSALARLLADLTAGRDVSEPVGVLGHSMGARLTMEALRQLRLTGRSDVLDRVEVMLAAPDIDIDLFREQITVVGKLRHPITILVSSDDPALGASARLSGRRMRLGQLNVHDLQVQRLAMQAGVRIVDITDLPTNSTAHSRYIGLISSGAAARSGNPLSGLRRAGAFVFDQVGDNFHGLGNVIGE